LITVDLDFFFASGDEVLAVFEAEECPSSEGDGTNDEEQFGQHGGEC